MYDQAHRRPRRELSQQLYIYLASPTGPSLCLFGLPAVRGLTKTTPAFGQPVVRTRPGLFGFGATHARRLLRLAAWTGHASSARTLQRQGQFRSRTGGGAGRSSAEPGVDIRRAPYYTRRGGRGGGAERRRRRRRRNRNVEEEGEEKEEKEEDDADDVIWLALWHSLADGVGRSEIAQLSATGTSSVPGPEGIARSSCTTLIGGG